MPLSGSVGNSFLSSHVHLLSVVCGVQVPGSWLVREHGESGSYRTDNLPEKMDFKQVTPICNEYFYFYFWPHCVTCWTLIPPPGIKQMLSEVEAWVLNHWTTWEVPVMIIIVGITQEGNIQQGNLT